MTNQYHLKVFQGLDFKQRHQRGRDQEKGTERRETLHLCFFLTEDNGETANTQYMFEIIMIVRVRWKLFYCVLVSFQAQVIYFPTLRWTSATLWEDEVERKQNRSF